MKNNVETFICRLSYEWNNPEGFFYKLNRKIIDYNGFNRTYNLLKDIKLYYDSDHSEMFDKCIVQFLWCIPIYMEKQEDIIDPLVNNRKTMQKYFIEQGDIISLLEQRSMGQIRDYCDMVETIENIISEILGEP